jgi:hypothetical protein
MLKKILHRPFFIKLLHWEYWPFNVVYGPIYLYWFWLSLRARSFFFFSTANPTIKNAGFLLESKKEIYDLIPNEYYPATLFFKTQATTQEILTEIKKHHLQYPLIGKPDIGMQGLSVKKLETESEVLAYAASSKVDFLVQEFVPYENEVGIFYYRYPNEANGHISGIVQKEFLSVTGDGVSTIERLLHKDKRFILQIETLRQENPAALKTILTNGENRILVPYGNHVRGAKFIDVSHQIDAQLTAAIDNACKKVDGFYFGRMDVRYNSWEELRQEKKFSIIELNGAGSEPTHMYDPKHSIFNAWKEIIKHWNILFKISRINHTRLQLPYMSTATGLQMFRENKAYLKMIRTVLKKMPEKKIGV